MAKGWSAFPVRTDLGTGLAQPGECTPLENPNSSSSGALWSSISPADYVSYKGPHKLFINIRDLKGKILHFIPTETLS